MVGDRESVGKRGGENKRVSKLKRVRESERDMVGDIQ